MELVLDDSTADGGRYGVPMGKNIFYRVWTEPNAHSGGFIAFWVSPGLTPAVVRSANGSPTIYTDTHTAELAAWRRMAADLNKPRSKATSGKPERYVKMTGPEFAAALQEAGITPTFMAFLYGTSQQRVLDWIDGVPNADIPHPARLLLALFKFDESNMDICEAITERVTTERKPRREDTG